MAATVSAPTVEPNSFWNQLVNSAGKLTELGTNTYVSLVNADTANKIAASQSNAPIPAPAPTYASTARDLKTAMLTSDSLRTWLGVAAVGAVFFAAWHYGRKALG